MKKIEKEKLVSVNGGWKKWSDAWLPIDNYQSKDDYLYTGTHNGYVYMVYWRPGYWNSEGFVAGHKYRTA